ncbi:pyridoxal-dependent decarboxylase [Spongiivirga sp. MCCC 1A20706]|uniref:pyridoxal phosphate-dependent decarboxylase family protein n=1 Tax=Spongiivirga sp. MCCC 1A20706 TaxID=3160963 RepID=UPI0039774501
MSTIKNQMQTELKSKIILNKARNHAFEYIDQIDNMDVFPSDENLQRLDHFDEVLRDNGCAADELLDTLHTYGSPATVAQTGGRYYGFVNGNVIPASLGVKWLTDIWDQVGGLYVSSPINSKLESVCERWLKNILRLPESTVAGFVSGTSMANLSALAAARFQILKNLGWDINKKGLNGAPKIRVIAHEQVHASIKRTLIILGFGSDNVEKVPADNQGRVVVGALPKLDKSCLVLLQAGNVNTGAFDNFDAVCDLANKANAWVHIDGAFGLWAAATESMSHLTKGMEKASSWAVDGHKTLNTPYDSGIVLCKHPDALVSAIHATGDYLIHSEQKDPYLYGPEMSKRCRAIELWAVMKYLGKNGIDKMITGFNERAKQLAKGLKKIGFTIHNEVVFNQVLISYKEDTATNNILDYVQQSGRMWCGGTIWNNRSAIRLSICSWMTDENDIIETINIFEKAVVSLTKKTTV